MPSTYTLISSNVLTSSAASVTFSAIPSTYTDLVIRASIRSDQGSINTDVLVSYNAIGGTSYSRTWLQGDGATATSGRTANTSSTNVLNSAVGNGATSNTFSNWELYIPSYTASQNKPYNAFAVGETNATTAYIVNVAGLFRNTSAISSILFEPGGGNFVSGSSFYLYGIKNS
jgi:hypothetical protein